MPSLPAFIAATPCLPDPFRGPPRFFPTMTSRTRPPSPPPSKPAARPPPPSPPHRPPPPPTATPASTFAQIDGVSIHHALFPPTRPRQTLLLCLHGFGASLFSFTLFAPFVTSPRRWLSLLAYDAPGFGLTERPAPLRFYTPAFSARVAAALADAYAPDAPYAICAHSMGCLAAARAALADPDRCVALVLIAPALVPRAPLPALLRAVSRGVMSALAWLTIGASVLFSPLLALVLRRVVGSRSFWRRGLSLSRGNGEVPEDVVDGYRAPTKAQGWDTGVLNFCRAALMDRARALGEKEDFVAMLAALGERAPRVLIVHGEKDRLVPLANSRRLVERLPGASLVVMDECGHVPHEEEPELFADVVGEYLEKAGLAVPDV